MVLKIFKGRIQSESVEQKGTPNFERETLNIELASDARRAAIRRCDDFHGGQNSRCLAP
jgi:hypothetical protein